MLVVADELVVVAVSVLIVLVELNVSVVLLSVTVNVDVVNVDAVIDDNDVVSVLDVSVGRMQLGWHGNGSGQLPKVYDVRYTHSTYLCACACVPVHTISVK